MGPARSQRSLTGASLPEGLQLGAAVASGASGTVHRGWHVRHGAVAVKVAHAADDWNATRLLREANAAAAVDDPGVVRVVACGRLDDGRAWVAMEWIDGVTLEDALATPWPAARIVEVAAQLARALAAAHAAGVVHRDLKPANVMLRGDRAIVVDWGIARRAGDPASSASRCAGTPHYMAPEQAMGEDADARADLYALGCVLVRMWTGRVPFEGSSVEVMLAHLGAAPPALDGAPPALAALVTRLLAKRPDDRPSSAAEVARALEQLAMAHVDPFGPTVAVPTLAPRPARSGLGIALLALAAMVLGAGAFAAVRWLELAPAAVASAGAVLPALPAPVLPRPTPSDDQVVIVVDGASSMRATLRGNPVAGGSLDVALEMWDDEDVPIAAPSVAATLRAPGGRTIALGVPGTDGVFRLHAAVATPGEHILTVFAPTGETTFSLRITVGDRPSS